MLKKMYVVKKSEKDNFWCVFSEHVDTRLKTYTKKEAINLADKINKAIKNGYENSYIEDGVVFEIK